MEGEPTGDAPRELDSLPSSFAATRSSLHRVAERIVAAARKPDNEIALAATPGGFGTPPFEFEGRLQRVRVERGELVRELGEEERRAPLTTLQDAATLVADLLPADAELGSGPLDVDPEAARILGQWYALGAAVLGELVAGADPGDDPSPLNLWPEHFDLAVEIGSEADGVRANYGFSPGDDQHPEPYLYVGPWTAEVSGELWRARGFRGAELGYAELRAAADPRAAAIGFCRTRKQELRKVSE
jgi:hypothetical protein